MNHQVDADGLRRLVTFELLRLVPDSREEAKRLMKGRVGVYDFDGSIIDAGINSYFSSLTPHN